MAARRKTNRKADSGDATPAVERAGTAQPTAARSTAAPLDAPDSITATRRKVCNLLEFWRVCADKTCKRSHACMGDADTCAIHWMRHVPQRFKAWFRHALRHSVDGASPSEASRLADEDLAPYDAAVDKMPLDERPPGWDWGRDNIPPPPARSMFELPQIRRVEPPPAAIDEVVVVPPPRPDPPPMPAPSMLRCGQRR